MGWLQSVGSIKLYVSFAQYGLFYRVFLQETYNFIDPTNCSHPILDQEEVLERRNKVRIGETRNEVRIGERRRRMSTDEERVGEETRGEQGES